MILSCLKAGVSLIVGEVRFWVQYWSSGGWSLVLGSLVFGPRGLELVFIHWWVGLGTLWVAQCWVEPGPSVSSCWALGVLEIVPVLWWMRLVPVLVSAQ